MNDLESKPAYEGPGARLWKVSISVGIYKGVIALACVIAALKYQRAPSFGDRSDATRPAKLEAGGFPQRKYITLKVSVCTIIAQTSQRLHNEKNVDGSICY